MYRHTKNKYVFGGGGGGPLRVYRLRRYAAPPTRLARFERRSTERLYCSLRRFFSIYRFIFCFIKRVAIILIFSLSFLPMVGCQDHGVPSRQYFDQAENAYRSGQYEVAYQNYTVFLRRNPDPQLARLAERRLLSIEREMECVFGQKSGPRPAYIMHDESGDVPVQHPRILTKSDRRTGGIP